MQVLSVRGAQEVSVSYVERRSNTRRRPTQTTPHFKGARLEICFTWCARPKLGLRAGPATPHRNRAYGHETSPQRGCCSPVRCLGPMAASARRSEYDSAAAVVGSDRTLTLNVEIAGSLASHGKARNRFVTHFNAFTRIAIVSNLVPCTSAAQVRHKCGTSAAQVRHKCGASAEHSADRVRNAGRCAARRLLAKTPPKKHKNTPKSNCQKHKKHQKRREKPLKEHPIFFRLPGCLQVPVRVRCGAAAAPVRHRYAGGPPADRRRTAGGTPADLRRGVLWRRGPTCSVLFAFL